LGKTATIRSDIGCLLCRYITATSNYKYILALRLYYVKPPTLRHNTTHPNVNKNFRNVFTARSACNQECCCAEYRREDSFARRLRCSLAILYWRCSIFARLSGESCGGSPAQNQPSVGAPACQRQWAGKEMGPQFQNRKVDNLVTGEEELK
jgi:hypothetical protein